MTDDPTEFLTQLQKKQQEALAEAERKNKILVEYFQPIMDIYKQCREIKLNSSFRELKDVVTMTPYAMSIHNGLRANSEVILQLSTAWVGPNPRIIIYRRSQETKTVEISTAVTELNNYFVGLLDPQAVTDHLNKSNNDKQ